MFDSTPLQATLPAADFNRARTWYADHLGLKPVEVDEDQGAAWYETGGVKFLLYQSAFAGTNQATSAAFTVTDVPAAAATLRDRGVVFEDYDMGDFKTEDGILTLPDGNQAAWFKDSEGNILSIGTM